MVVCRSIFAAIVVINEGTNAQRRNERLYSCELKASQIAII